MVLKNGVHDSSIMSWSSVAFVKIWRSGFSVSAVAAAAPVASRDSNAQVTVREELIRLEHSGNSFYLAPLVMGYSFAVHLANKCRGEILLTIKD